MNKQLFFFRTAIVALFVLLLASCSKTNKEGRLVPINASYVVHFNGGQLSDKINWDDIKNSDLFKEAMADSSLPSSVMDALNDPEKSGIDIKKDLLGFLVMDKQETYIGVTGSIKDAEKFGLFNTGIIKESTQKQDGDIKYISTKQLFVGYDKDKFLYLSNAPFFHRMLGVDEGIKGSKDMQQTIEEIFKMPSDKSLSSNSKFTKLMNDKADVHIWYNGEEMIKASGLTEMIPIIDIAKFTKGFVNTASLTFNNGSITAKSQLYTSKELSEVLKKYEGGHINEAMVNKLPSSGVNAALAINFKPEIIRELIKLTGFDGLVSSQMKKETGISLDDFIKANKGDLLIAISNVHSKKDSFAFSIGPDSKKMMYNARPDADYIFSASINDKEAFNKLVQAAQQKAKDFVDEDSAKLNNMTFNTNDQYFAISNSKTMLDGYFSSNGNNDVLRKKMGNDPIGGYADIQALLKGMAPDDKADSTDKAMHALALAMWDNASLKGGQIEDGALVLNFEINLIDKNTNSLKQLTNYYQKTASMSRQKRKKEMEAFMSDMPPAPPKFVAPKSQK